MKRNEYQKNKISVKYFFLRTIFLYTEKLKNKFWVFQFSVYSRNFLFLFKFHHYSSHAYEVEIKKKVKNI